MVVDTSGAPAIAARIRAEIESPFGRKDADAFPESWNVWDSLGEAYTTRGDRARAIECYRASLQRNPDNHNGGTILERLTAEEEAERQPTQ